MHRYPPSTTRAIASVFVRCHARPPGWLSVIGHIGICSASGRIANTFHRWWSWRRRRIRWPRHQKPLSNRYRRKTENRGNMINTTSNWFFLVRNKNGRTNQHRISIAGSSEGRELVVLPFAISVFRGKIPMAQPILVYRWYRGESSLGRLNSWTGAHVVLMISLSRTGTWLLALENRNKNRLWIYRCDFKILIFMLFLLIRFGWLF